MKVVYVAGRFRGPSAWAIEQNISTAEQVGYEVACLGAMPLIPHANTRYFHGGIFDDAFWLAGTMELLRRCDAVIAVPGWEASSGARDELVEARERNMPVFFALGDLRAWLERT